MSKKYVVPVDMGSNQINNLSDPVSAQDGATKNYIDSNFSIKLSNYVLVKTLSDLPTPISNVISLVANTCYQINGIIALGLNQVKIANNVLINGNNKFTDGFIATHALPMFIDGGVASLNVTIRFVSISNATASSSIFLFTGSGSSDVRFCQFISCNSLGNISNSGTVNFYNNYINNSSGGITFNSIADLHFFDNHFDVNLGTITCLTLGATTFQDVMISRNQFEVLSTQTGTNISTSAIITKAGTLSVNIFVAGGTYQVGVNYTSAVWKLYGNVGVTNSGGIGSVSLPIGTIVSSGTATGGYALLANEMTYRVAGSNNSTFIAYMEFIIPADYGVGGTLNFPVQDVRIGQVWTATVYQNGTVDALINAMSIVPTAINTWELKTLTFGSALIAGSRMQLKLNYTVTGASDYNYLFNPYFNYIKL